MRNVDKARLTTLATVAVLLGFGSMQMTGSAALVKTASTSRSELAKVAPDHACKYARGLCVRPKHSKMKNGESATILVAVPVNEQIESMQETDTCQGFATFTLAYIQENISYWNVQTDASAQPGTCTAKFTGVASGKNVGPAKYKLTVIQ